MPRLDDTRHTWRMSLNVVSTPEGASILGRTLLDRLVESGLWFNFDHIGTQGEGVLLAASSAEEVREQLATTVPGEMKVARVGKDDLRDVGGELIVATRLKLGVVRWQVGPNPLWSLNLTMNVSGAQYAEMLPGVVERSASFFERVAALGDRLPPLSRVGLASIQPLEFASVRPPREPLWWPPALIHVTDPRTLPFTDALLRPHFEHFLKSPLPPGAERRHAGNGLLIDIWSPNPRDLDQLERDVSAQQAWYAEALHLPIASLFNRWGDEQIVPVGPESAESPLAFYDPATARGIVTTVPDHGSLDEASLSEPLHRLREQRLSDGRPLQRLDILFPTRPDAVSLRPQAKRLGFARTLYVADDTTVWNINPIRRWRDALSPHRLATVVQDLPPDQAADVSRAAEKLYPHRDSKQDLQMLVQRLESDLAPSLVRRALEVIDRASPGEPPQRPRS